MNKPGLINALITAINSTSVLRTGTENPNLHGTPTNATLMTTVGMANCTQACALGGLACVVALPNEANFWYVAWALFEEREGGDGAIPIS
ncbi:hypothetical protein BDV23DRAFT_152542 [Aspergillus alliaceus]|uniref:Uncharacterized protein n=1 Tax=Petromyces alliaceus TaxID=209559 RepID=A0A5N7CCY0_PETAA|nr:hypothetical protein BDV23DRAFT_152542 [Aspergillus alliaceus]